MSPEGIAAVIFVLLTAYAVAKFVEERSPLSAACSVIFAGAFLAVIR